MNIYDFQNDLVGVTMQAFGRPFTYKRGAEETSITGVPGSEPFAATNPSDVYVDGSQRQFTFPISGFPYDEPLRDDLVIDDLAVTYVVTDPIYTLDAYVKTYTIYAQRYD